MHLRRRKSFSLCLSIYVYLHLFSVKRLDKNISNNIFLVDLFYYWYLSGQSYNYLLWGAASVCYRPKTDVFHKNNIARNTNI